MSVNDQKHLSTARELGFALHDVARLLKTYSDQRVRETNMTRSQWSVLARLKRCEGVKQSELAQLLDLAPITLGRLIDRLTAAGLVERRDDPADRRAFRLYLTKQATPVLDVLDDLAEDILGRAFSGLDEQDQSTLRAGIEIIRSNIRRELHSGGHTP